MKILALYKPAHQNPPTPEMMAKMNAFIEELTKAGKLIATEGRKAGAAGMKIRMRQGQLNLGCANCHDDNWDKRLAGSAITQGHATGYPLYRLEWQSLGSLQRRLRACITGIRAQAYDYGAPELVELELYLMSRARGMPMEAPAVRP